MNHSAILALSPHQTLLLAVHLAANASIDSLAFLASRHASVLRTDVILRALLTYLPETTDPALCVPFLLHLSADTLHSVEPATVDTLSVAGLSDEEAARRARKLHLLPLSLEGTTLAAQHEEDPLIVFLLRRVYRVSQEAGLLSQLPGLLAPFAENSVVLRRWSATVLLPLARRTCDYYHTQSPDNPAPSLQEFESLSDRAAVDFLLSNTGTTEERLRLVGRDLRGLISPWLLGDTRWEAPTADGDVQPTGSKIERRGVRCPAWERVLEWLVTQATANWAVSVSAVEQWDGPGDIDMGPGQASWLEERQQRYLDNRYGRCCLAAAYSIADTTLEAFAGAYSISSRFGVRFLDELSASPHAATSDLKTVPKRAVDLLVRANVGYHRKDLLHDSNPLTNPDEPALRLLQALITSAFILTSNGYPCSIRRAGDLLLLADAREQKNELKKAINAASSSAPKADDGYWAGLRDEIIWLHSWGWAPPPQSASGNGAGIFGKVNRELLETEFLAVLLAQSRFSLARSLYEDTPEPPLSAKALQETVHSAAMNAYDKASNPNRTRGGLKKCDDIMHTFPRTIGASMDSYRCTEALLKTSHALSSYRLALKQGEPFSPVVLRVHSDPVSIIAKVLEQNPGSYTGLQDFLDLGSNMIRAGLGLGHRRKGAAGADDEGQSLQLAERRVAAMCVEAALREDDFETAYSYVISRLADNNDDPEYSWAAALLAGQYVRTGRSIRPTHLGTASGNLDIRHLEQRIDCLAVALRIAPASRLQDILKTFRRCEEQLEAALREEAAREDAWDSAGDLSAGIPGSFADEPDRRDLGRTRPAAVVGPPLAGRSLSAEAAPMSLFDLSRATAKIASQNLSVLSGLAKSASASTTTNTTSPDDADSTTNTHAEESDGRQPQGAAAAHDSSLRTQKTRKRDQLRDAAVGTLVSGVGWLINANPPQNEKEDRQQSLVD